jgi:hypothetical protein
MKSPARWLGRVVVLKNRIGGVAARFTSELENDPACTGRVDQPAISYPHRVADVCNAEIKS